MTSLRRGWFHLAAGAGLGRIFGFLSNLMLSRWLGPVELGLFNLLSTTIQTGDTLVRLGSDFAINYELGADHHAVFSKNGVRQSHALAQICTLGTLLLTVIGGVWIFQGHGLFPPYVSQSQRISLGISLLLIFVIEGTCVSAWEILLVSKRTRDLALRQGLFYPARLFLAAISSTIWGITGASYAWLFVSLVQYVWLQLLLKPHWAPFKLTPILVQSISFLLKRGLPFYASNLLSSTLFYFLLLDVADSSGLEQVGFLRIAQIVQQLFAFLPATLVPILFLQLRSEATLEKQVFLLERPIRIVWFLSLLILFAYCIFDRSIIIILFGENFVPAVVPTRLLMITALLECLSQLAVQPILAVGRTKLYFLIQNAAAIVSGSVGLLAIPHYGLSAYLMMRLIYVSLQFISFSIPLYPHLNKPSGLFPCIMSTILLIIVVLIQQLRTTDVDFSPLPCSLAIIALSYIYRVDLYYLFHMFARPRKA